MYQEKLESISLNGLNGNFTYQCVPVKKESYYDEESGNLILFSMYGDCEVEDIVNGIRVEAYDYLINILNNNKNLIIDWSATEGTTSDYIIYHGFDEDYIENSLCTDTLSIELDKLRTEGSGYGTYKYQEFKDGKYIQLTF